MTNPEDVPSAEDIVEAGRLVRVALEALVTPPATLVLDARSAVMEARLVLETAWKVRGNRERREDYERITRTGAAGESGES